MGTITYLVWRLSSWRIIPDRWWWSIYPIERLQVN